MDLVNFKIKLFHIGGGDLNFGPAEKILATFPQFSEVTLFEIRGGKQGIVEEKTFDFRGNQIPLRIVNSCIWKEETTVNFKITKDLLASSIYNSNEKYKKLIPSFSNSTDQNWGDFTKKIDEITVNTQKLKNLEELVGTPDFISSDAQGAELDIFSGLENLIDGIQGLITEAEIVEIYSGAPQFHHQLEFFKKHNFFFIDMFSKQDWYKKVRYGKGIFSVGEALFIKDVDNSEQNYETLLKNGIISFSFERFDLALAAFEKVKVNYKIEYCKLMLNKNFSWISNFIKEMYKMKKYLEDDRHCGWKFELVDYERGPMSHEWGKWIKTPTKSMTLRESTFEDWFKDNPFLEDRFLDK
jgi:hypothetical protein